MNWQEAKQRLAEAYAKSRAERRPTLASIVRRDGTVPLGALWADLPAGRRDRVRFDRLQHSVGYGLARLLRRRFSLPRGLDAAKLFPELRARLPTENPFVEAGRSEAAIDALGFVLGVSRANSPLNLLDRATRVETAHDQLQRWFEGWSERGGWVVGFDDAQRGDPETAAFLQWAAQVRWKSPPLWVLGHEPMGAGAPWATVIEAWRKKGALIELELDAPPMDYTETPLSDGALEVARRGAVVDLRFSRAFVLQTGLSAAEVEEGFRELAASPRFEVASAEEVAFRSVEDHARVLERVTPEERHRWLATLAPQFLAELDRAGAGWEVLGPMIVPGLVRAARGQNDEWEASLWLEVLGLLHRKHARPASAAEAFREALFPVENVRRKVLLRRLVEEEYAAGRPEEGLTALAARVPAGPTPPVPEQVARYLHALAQDPLERWDQLSASDAQFALELSRADVLSQLGRTTETRAALDQLEPRLEELRGQVGIHLWVTWARIAIWFATEVLGDMREAESLSERVRKKLDRRAFERDQDRLTFLRTQELVASRTGDYELAQRLLTEQLELSQRVGDFREEVIAWNSRAIVHMAVGELRSAHVGFTQSRTLARANGIRRREAVALHNVGLVQHELGEYAAAEATQREYLELSRQIGNLAAEAYGPAAIAAVALSLGEFERSAEEIARARAQAEKNGWSFLIAWVRALTGQAAVLRVAQQGEGAALRDEDLEHLTSGLKMLEERKLYWTEEFDAGEHSAFLGVALWRTRGHDAALSVVRNSEERIPASCAVSLAWLEAAESLLAREPLDASIAWFEQRGAARSVQYLKALAGACPT